MIQITKIGLVDDHNLFRRTLSDLITQKLENFKVIIEATNGKDLIEKIRKMDPSDLPEIIIADISMPIMDGFQITHWLKCNYPSIKVIALSMHDDEMSIIRMLRVGVDGYLLKRMDVPEMCTALQTIAGNETYYADFSESTINTFQIKANQSDQLNSELLYTEIWDSLGEKEKEFVRLCCTEITYKAMSAKMKISFGSIGSYRDKVFTTFKVKNRIALVILILKNRIITF